MEAFWLSVGIIFLAETGDKTQLVALCLASRYSPKIVLSAIFFATLIIHVVSVLLGGGVSKLVPASYISLAAGVAFIIFALWTLKGDCLSQEECDNIQGRSPFWVVFTTFFLAELGDKTMLSTVALGAKYAMIPVWLGSTVGMVLADGIAIVIGLMLGKRLPERAVKIGAAVIFLGFGIFNGYQGAVDSPALANITASVIVALSIVVYFYLVKVDRCKIRSAAVDS